MSDTTAKDWTAKNGKSNASSEFLLCVQLVARIVADSRIGDHPLDTARVIVAQLAHVRGLGPHDA